MTRPVSYNSLIPQVQQVIKVADGFLAPGSSSNTADPWVIALALRDRLTVVTEEVLVPATARNHKKKIPNACQALNVPCLSLTALIQAEGWILR